MKTRTTRTYAIDDELYEKFEKIVSENHLNRSRLIESFIIKFVEDNSIPSIEQYKKAKEIIKLYEDAQSNY